MSTVLATGGRGSVAPAGAELGLCEWNFIGNYEESVKADHANPRGVREIQSETGRDGANEDCEESENNSRECRAGRVPATG